MGDRDEVFDQFFQIAVHHPPDQIYNRNCPIAAYVFEAFQNPGVRKLLEYL